MALAFLVYWWVVTLTGVLVGQALVGHHLRLALAIGGSLVLTAGGALGYLRRQGRAGAHQPADKNPTTSSAERESSQLTTDPHSGEPDTTDLLGPGHWRAISRGRPTHRQTTPDCHRG